MRSTLMPAEVYERLSGSHGIDNSTVETVLAEFLEATSETLKEFVLRRHRELQLQGLTNALIFPKIREELGSGRFSAPSHSERQIRRVIYG